MVPPTKIRKNWGLTWVTSCTCTVGRSRSSRRYFFKLADSFIREARWWSDNLWPVRTRGSFSPSRIAQMACIQKASNSLNPLNEHLCIPYKSNIKTISLFIFIYNQIRNLLMLFKMLLQIESKSVPPAPPTGHTIHWLGQKIPELLHGFLQCRNAKINIELLNPCKINIKNKVFTMASFIPCIIHPHHSGEVFVKSQLLETVYGCRSSPQWNTAEKQGVVLDDCTHIKTQSILQQQAN